MRFGYNVITESGKEALARLSIRFFRNSEDTMWLVDSEEYDIKEEEWRNKRPEWIVRDATPSDLRKEYIAQQTRVWKHPDTGKYYFLFQDMVFVKYDKIELDNHTLPGQPSTQIVVSILDVVPKDQQEHYREILINRPPNANAMEGGVLI